MFIVKQKEFFVNDLDIQGSGYVSRCRSIRSWNLSFNINRVENLTQWAQKAEAKNYPINSLFQILLMSESRWKIFLSSLIIVEIYSSLYLQVP